MKRQILIMSIIYFIVMGLGYFWCNPNLIEKSILFELFTKTIIWSLLSYGLYILLKILSKTKILNILFKKAKFIMTYLPYIYLIIFPLEAFIGLVMVFIFKEYNYAYAFLPILTIIHATKLSQDLINKFTTY